MSNWERVRLRIETKQDYDESNAAAEMTDARTISTHILDTSKGTPANNVKVTLYRLQNDAWVKMIEARTDSDGRASHLLSLDQFHSGVYKLSFEVKQYFEANQTKSFYPFIEIIVECERGQHYHVPLLLNPFGYSTYRGS